MTRIGRYSTPGQLPFQLSIKCGVSATDQQEGHGVRRSDVEQSLGRVLTGSSFRSSPQCQALLRYIVEHSLSHENELLRERVIGIKVFGRPSDYDSGNDPIVRARAAEIRKRLAQHYLHGEGASEEIRIEIPPGSYRAVFATRNADESTEARRGTELSVEPPASSASQVDQLEEPLNDKARVGSPTVEVGHTSPHGRRWIDGGFKPLLVMIASIGLATGVVGFFVGRSSTAHTHTSGSPGSARVATCFR
jgi:hypothetical protein